MPYAGTAAQKEAETKFGVGAPGFPQGIPMRGALSKGTVDALTAGAPARGVLGTTTEGTGATDQGVVEGGGAGFLANQRKPIFDEALSDPATKAKLHQMMSSEGGGARTVEALANRVAMVRQKVPGYSIKDELNSGFYGPLKRGYNVRIDAATAAKYDRTIDMVKGGSNLIQGRTNQGTLMGPGGRPDPGVNLPGRVRSPDDPNEVYNFWEGRRKGVEFGTGASAAFAKSQAAAIASAELDRTVVDKRSVKTVKVDATGKVNVNIAGGEDATLGSQGLFKPSGVERKTQMVAAETGPQATFKERFEGAKPEAEAAD